MKALLRDLIVGEVVEELLPAILPDAELLDSDGWLGVFGRIGVLEQDDAGCDPISILIELLANAGQEGCGGEACSDEACEKKNALRR